MRARVRSKLLGTAIRSKGLSCRTLLYLCAAESGCHPALSLENALRRGCPSDLLPCNGHVELSFQGKHVMQLMSALLSPLMNACLHISSFKTSLTITIFLLFRATQSSFSADQVRRYRFSLSLPLLLPPAISLTSKPHEFFDYIY